MNQSQSVKNLNLAILNAQGEFPIIEKSADNPFYKSKYAPYDAIMRSIRPILVKNRLVIGHAPNIEENELEAVVNVNVRGDKETTSNQIISIPQITVTTRVTHVDSEEWKEISMKIPAEKGNSHGIQAVITYVKRNNIILLLDIVAGDEDDDGNGSVTPDADRNYLRPRGNEQRPRQDAAQKQTTPAQQQKSLDTPPKHDLEKEVLDTPLQDARKITENPGSLRDLNQNIKNAERQASAQTPAQTGAPMTDAQRSRAGVLIGEEYDKMKEALKANGISPAAWKVWLMAKYKVDSIQFILRTDYEAIMETIKMDQTAIDPNAKVGG